jgi:hypothetical protein
MVKFQAKIMTINRGERYLITVPKKLVESDVIDPDCEYVVELIDPRKTERIDPEAAQVTN